MVSMKSSGAAVGVLLVAGFVWSGASPTASGDEPDAPGVHLLNRLHDMVAPDRPITMSAIVDIEYHPSLGAEPLQLRYDLVLDGALYAVHQSTPNQSEPGQWVEHLSQGWDGQTAWRHDASQSMLTFWNEPIRVQPGILPNPCFLPLAFLETDFTTPGVRLSRAQVDDALARLEIESGMAMDGAGRLIVPMLQAAQDRASAASVRGELGAEILDGASFRLTPANDETAFPLRKFEILDAMGALVLDIDFHGQKLAVIDGDQLVWPSTVTLTHYEAGVALITVQYTTQVMIHDPIAPGACGPEFIGVQTIVDGDLPPPPIAGDP